MKKAALAQSAHENVVVAIVVVVANGCAHPVQADCQAGFRSDVSERAIAVVVIELQRGNSAAMSGPVLAVYQQNVRIAIVIVINEGTARSQGFRQVFRAKGAIVVNETDSGGLRDVSKTDACSRRLS